MPMLPIADFLAGALLTLLLPVALLIALVAWYWLFSSRVPETVDTPGPGAAATGSSASAAANPGPQVSESLPPEPGV